MAFGKAGNKTIKLISILVLFLFIWLIGGIFGIVPEGWALLTAKGASLFTVIGAVVLLLETFFEGKKPKLGKDIMATMNTIFAVALLVYAAILYMGNPAVTGMWRGFLGVAYIGTWLLLARELI